MLISSACVMKLLKTFLKIIQKIEALAATLLIMFLVKRLFFFIFCPAPEYF